MTLRSDRQMGVRKKNTETFYSELRNLTPELCRMEAWAEFDQEDTGWIGARILSSVAELTITWTSQGQLELTDKVLNFFERSYDEFEDGSNAYIYTDFHPTIINCQDSGIRDTIKSSMGPETIKSYNQLIELGLYAEH